MSNNEETNRRLSGTWVCPLCVGLRFPEDQIKAHQVSHIPPETMANYRSTFLHASDGLLIGMAFLHCLTHQHAEGRCCRPENGGGPRPA